MDSFEWHRKIPQENSGQIFELNLIKEIEDSAENSSDKEDLKAKRTGKGLKQLSVLVWDLVNEKKSLSYKEVAELILADDSKRKILNLSCGQKSTKEDLNIKRRVYDALNVLIAAEILLKDGKKVKPFVWDNSQAKTHEPEIAPKISGKIVS